LEELIELLKFVPLSKMEKAKILAYAIVMACITILLLTLTVLEYKEYGMNEGDVSIFLIIYAVDFVVLGMYIGSIPFVGFFLFYFVNKIIILPFVFEKIYLPYTFFMDYILYFYTIHSAFWTALATVGFINDLKEK
jgi:hypothetical protein